jgi:hypothetical protein
VRSRSSGSAATQRVSRAFPSWNRSILTEIYLRHACSDHEIEDGHARTGAKLFWEGPKFSEAHSKFAGMFAPQHQRLRDGASQSGQPQQDEDEPMPQLSAKARATCEAAARARQRPDYGLSSVKPGHGPRVSVTVSRSGAVKYEDSTDPTPSRDGARPADSAKPACDGMVLGVTVAAALVLALARLWHRCR